VALLAVLKTGAAYVPIDPAYPQSRKDYILADSGCQLQITPAFMDDFRQSAAAFDANFASAKVQPNQLAYMIYTSGSTGQPKGVMIEQHSLVNLCYWHMEMYEVDASSRGTLFAGIGFDASVWEVYPYLLCGASLYPIAKEELRYDTVQLRDFLNDNGITHSYLPTQICQSFAEQNFTLDHTTILTGGDLLKLPKGSNLRIFNNYGPTENTVVTTAYEIQPGAFGIVPIGKPLSNNRIYILSNSNQLQPTGVAGELCIAGAGLARGYANRAEITKEKFVADPFVEGARMYRSGDLARWLPDGNIEFLGRIDKQVKIRGFRIELGEIENNLVQHEAIQDAVVLAVEQGGEKYLLCYYVAPEVMAVSALNAYLSASLPDYMIPAQYVRLETIPLTANGKVNRRALPKPEQQLEQEELVLPANDTESELRRIWSEVLQLDEGQISVVRSFFELGGHSLKATVLVNKISRAMEVEVPLKEIFGRQDIRSLGNFIDQAQKVAYAAIPTAPPMDAYPLSSAQKRMYFLYEFDKSSTAYNMPQVSRLGESLDKDRLEKAFRQLIGRHEALRTSFHQGESEPVQKIATKVNFQIEQLQAEKAAISNSISEFIRPFDLGVAPLMRVGILEVDNGEQLLLIDLHHIISDGISQGLMVRDFLDLYEGRSLEPTALTYKDFAYWQQQPSQQVAKEVQKKFWLKTFEAEVPVLDLPTDFQRPLVNTFAGDELEFQLDKDQLQKLKALAKQEGTSLYMLILSAYTILLSKLSNQSDVVVGTPVSGRQHADLENMVGMFVNTLPLRNHPEGHLMFRQYLADVKTRTLAYFDHQSFQYEELIDELKLARNTGRNPLFDAVFAFDNFSEDDFVGSTWNAESYDSGHRVAKFDLSLSASESDNG
ncbi:MAG: amino acid adenylation domain-containing protein, partial [Bacteroidota bacterium]